MMCGKGRDGVAQEGAARDRRLDTVRSLAIIMVLVIHSAAAGLAGRAPGTADWWGPCCGERRPGPRCRCSSCAAAR